MSTVILLVAIVLAAVGVNRLRGSSSASRSKTLLWSAQVVTLAVSIVLYVVLQASLVPITPTNFSIIVLGVMYFGPLQSMRIQKQLR